jgi:hypothetical protein
MGQKGEAVMNIPERLNELEALAKSIGYRKGRSDGIIIGAVLVALLWILFGGQS